MGDSVPLHSLREARGASGGKTLSEDERESKSMGIRKKRGKESVSRSPWRSY